MKSKSDELLEKLNKHPVNNDYEFLECFIDLDNRLKIVEARMNKEELKQKIPSKYWYLLEDEDFCADLQFLLNKKPSRMAIFCYLDNWDYLKNNL